jgi:hypothetical protein
MDSSQPVHITRKANLTHAEFVAQHLRPSQPVILTDATAHWAALGKWTPTFFKQRYGPTPLTIDGRQHTMESFIDLVLRSRPGNPAPYLHNHLLEKWLPELLPDILPLPHCTSPNWFESRLFPSRQSCTFIELYIGGYGAVFPKIHFDNWHTHAFLMQIYGLKHYVIYAPEQARLLYPREDIVNVSLVNDVENPDLERFPLFAQAKPGHCWLHPGETLFVPAGWWHTARILSPSITVSANTANETNWRNLVPEYCAHVAGHRSRPYRYALKAYLYGLSLLGPLLG